MRADVEKIKRPKVLPVQSAKLSTGCGNLYIMVTEHEGRPFEVFATLGKAGGCAKCQLEAITRCISTGLRWGIPIEEYVDQLAQLSCPNPTYDNEEQILSCPDAIAKGITTILGITKKEGL